MSAATDADLVALGERFEKLLLEYLDDWGCVAFTVSE